MAHADFLSRNLSNTSKVNFLEQDKDWLVIENECDSELSEIIPKFRNNQFTA